MHARHAKKTVSDDGIKFPSQTECARYYALRDRLRSGEIKELSLQPQYDLEINGVKVGVYTADFRYFDIGAGIYRVEEAKPWRWKWRKPRNRPRYRERIPIIKQEQKLRIKVCEAIYEITIEIVF